jgi:16S rRNA (cytosine967-C5)-methyltransferase
MVRVERLRPAQEPREAVSPTRRVAYRTVRRVFGDGAWADHAFRAEAARARLGARDRALAQQLAYGTVQRRASLDYVLSAIASRPVAGIDPGLRDLLRLGIYQLLHLGGIPDHAAVNETVELAKEECGRGHRFANALMRRAAREGADLLRELSPECPREVAILHSHPEWLVQLWWDLLGPAEALALLERDNVAAESAVRVNELLLTPAEATRAFAEAGVRVRPAEHLPEGLVLDTSYDLHGSPLWAAGAIMPQSRASMLVARILAPEPGERVLDMCAAPGAKTTHVAALMDGAGEVVAVERNADRAERLVATCERMAARQVRVVCADARTEAPDGPFDRVLVDPPCSDLGTLQSRPDLRWRKSPDQLAELAALQCELLDSAAARLRPGGVLVYSTCTLSPDENERQVRGFLGRRPGWEVDDLGAEYPEYAHPDAPGLLRLLPHQHGTDGFLVARLRRTEAR